MKSPNTCRDFLTRTFNWTDVSPQRIEVGFDRSRLDEVGYARLSTDSRPDLEPPED